MRKSKELRVGISAAKEAGKVIMKHYGKVCCVRKKSARLGIVTEADIKAQKKIKQVIRKSFPKAEFLAEEDKKHAKIKSDSFWVVDPIDGTLNFSRGVKSFCVSIALVKGKEPVLGVVLNPNNNDLFTAEKGKKAFLNGKRIKVSNVSRMESGLIDLSIPRRAEIRGKNFAVFKKLFKRMGSLRSFGTAALELCLVSAGWIDISIEYGLYPWDAAAGIVILQEAGGKVTNEKGKPYDLFGQKLMVATNKKLHKQVLKELGK